jgi:transcriptional regulator with XRE-family HTH domain
LIGHSRVSFIVCPPECLTVVTTLVHAGDAIEAGLRAAKALESSGIRVLRTYQDLVTRQDIASRLGVTRQAVGNWVRGERHDDTPFPSPVSLVAGGVWLWGDVVSWARASNHAVDEEHFPSLNDHSRLDVLIASGVGAIGLSTYTGAAADLAFRPRGARPPMANTYQHQYSLAAAA